MKYTDFIIGEWYKQKGNLGRYKAKGIDNSSIAFEYYNSDGKYLGLTHYGSKSLSAFYPENKEEYEIY